MSNSSFIYVVLILTNSVFKALSHYTERTPRALLPGILIVLLCCLGFVNRFVQDDAFISFRYAYNWVNGFGLTWNPGELPPIEGYTNFLWVILVAIAEYFHIDAVLWVYALGLICSVWTLLVTFKLAEKLLMSEAAAIVVIVLLGTNYTFSSYMTGGLETQLQTALLISLYYIVFNIIDQQAWPSYKHDVLLSLITAAAVMTRPDSFLLCVPVLSYLSFVIVKSDSSWGTKAASLFCLSFPGFIIAVVWLVSKQQYYGEILPHTFYVKTSGTSADLYRLGLNYIEMFFNKYLLYVPLLIAVIKYKILLSSKYFTLLLVLIAVWLAYIVSVGGDFMEFRFMVPILPILYIVVVRVLLACESTRLVYAVLGILIAASINHAIRFDGKEGIESVDMLHARINSVEENWKQVGITLGGLFYESDDPVSIAVTAAGAIPYYSRLKSIDMLGLNDRFIAENGVAYLKKTGHQLYTAPEYLVDSDVNIVLGHPRVSLSDDREELTIEDFIWSTREHTEYPENIKVYEIPLSDDYKLSVLYLTTNSSVDNVFRDKAYNSYVPKKLKDKPMCKSRNC